MVSKRCFSLAFLALTTCLSLRPVKADSHLNWQMNKGQAFGYVLVSAATHTYPGYFKSQGGIGINFEASSPALTSASWLFNNWAQWESNWITVHTDVESFPDFSWRSGTWIYKVQLSPQIVAQQTRWPQPSRAEDDPKAMGGIYWTQIYAFTLVSDTHPKKVWQPNEDFDARWYEYGITVSQHHFSGHQASSARQVAKQFITDLTGPANTALAAEERKVLAQLMDWDVEAEPQRDLPLIRPKGVPVVDMFSNCDWSKLGWPRNLQMALYSGLPRDEQCIELRNAYTRYPVVRNDPVVRSDDYKNPCAILKAVALESTIPDVVNTSNREFAELLQSKKPVV
ncbi:hypothetical protein L249_0888 [Ophiocordyceps polyrhachis-furcata BCC 54312]|uniref:Heat-labile enterotoxin n=1 Tax=Ophiocordyceps polyrhachis-furcata BCC 54312 TaxID=1330021 RepID=A0A367LCG8_9HYPO|nr:hypothetical protein L249_0888 [Ophiocordyceps polyrhachis-furcata BCC 54312]